MNVTLDGIILREEGRNISPTIYINDMYKKYLMFHGTKDRTVNPKISVVVYKLLKKYNKNVKLYMLEGADHGGSEFFTERILDIIEEFIQSNISD